MPHVFICYRRDDTAPYAGRLYDRLASEFGAGRIFMDLDAISPGQQFEDRIRSALAESDVVVVVIGRQWLAPHGPAGRPRLHSPDDYVRREVALALESGVHIIPTLVARAELPHADSLPLELKEITKLQVIELSDQRWGHDVGRLITSINAASPRSRVARVRRSLTKYAVWPVRVLTPLAAIGGIQLLNGIYERLRLGETYRMMATLVMVGAASAFMLAVERYFRDESRR